MATSPIYSWPEPDNTDLVKNGALAIRTLGNAIDTTMGTMTPKSIVDAKGDLIAASANDTPARLAVGANGTTLIADSSTSTGLRYQSSYNANGIINGGYDIAQRGTSINTAAGTFAYTLDRLWVFSNGPAVTTSQQVTGDTTNLPNIQYCARLQRQSGQTGTLATVWNMPLETRDSIRFAGQTVTFSYYARKSATYTATLTSSLLSGTGTDQSGLGGFTGQAVVATFGATLTNTWQRFQGTGTVATNATGIRIEFSTNSWVGTAGAADYVEITGVQLELGSVPTSFKRAGGGTMQQELAACQRYYWRTSASTAFAYFSASGVGTSTTTAVFPVVHPVTMRIAPVTAGLESNLIAINDGSASLGGTLTNIIAQGSANTSLIQGTISIVGAIQYRPYYLIANNSTSAYLGFSAEL
jgi:hypothetical protein